MKTEQTATKIRRQMKEVRSEMRELGIKRTSCFNGGMDRQAQRYNERMFALETQLKDATKRALCVMCGKPTENLASDDTEYQCDDCATLNAR